MIRNLFLLAALSFGLGCGGSSSSSNSKGKDIPTKGIEKESNTPKVPTPDKD